MATRRIGFLRLQLQEIFANQIARLEEAKRVAELQAGETRLCEIHLERRKEQLGDWLREQQQTHQFQFARLTAEAQRLRCWEARLETRRLTAIAKLA